MLLAWDNSQRTNKEIVKYLNKSTKDHRLTEIALLHKTAICEDMQKRKFSKVTAVEWQAHNNRNSNGSPADIVFPNHTVGGVSVKHGSDIVGNFGTKEFSNYIKRPKGIDLFRFLAPEPFDTLLKKVKENLKIPSSFH